MTSVTGMANPSTSRLTRLKFDAYENSSNDGSAIIKLNV